MAGDAGPGSIEPVRFEVAAFRRLAGLLREHEFDNSGVADQWAELGGMVGQVSGRLGSASFGVVWDRPFGMEYLTAIELELAAPLPAGWVERTLASARYAVFAHTSAVASVMHTWQAIAERMAPGSDLARSAGPAFERYDASFDPLSGRGGFEIWVPLQGSAVSGRA